ncbi:MAG: peptidylprolyl isomerase [Chitinophagales bacterium]|nr:peptidylprolyl isomerase [Chitinophagales bacterium]MDW8393898.1 peptidylprolyl isomerase [Chitinophagales bacterium]
MYDEYLYPSDVAGVGSGALRPEDSLLAVRKYIESWVRHKLMLRMAEEYLPQEQQQMQQRLRDYQESLLIYLYEHSLLQQKLDTTIAPQELEAYYEEHKNSFQLKQPIVQLRYLVLDVQQTAELDSIRQWLRRPNAYNQPKLEGIAADLAIRYDVGESRWYNKEDLWAFLPVDLFDLEQAYLNRSLVEVSDSAFRYLIRFLDYRNKGMTPPLEFVRDEISLILVNKRKTAFLQQLHRDMLQQAQRNNHFQIYLTDTIAPFPVP